MSPTIGMQTTDFGEEVACTARMSMNRMLPREIIFA